MASYQYIFTMRDLRKVFPGGREVLKDITLAFLPGAKIGVIGGNGAGKSTLLRIMAGVETEFTGEARCPSPPPTGTGSSRRRSRTIAADRRPLRPRPSKAWT